MEIVEIVEFVEFAEIVEEFGGWIYVGVKIMENPRIPQSILIFVECYDKVRHACLRVVAASFFLQALNFSKVASEVAIHER